jgi:ClpP class serine protease
VCLFCVGLRRSVSRRISAVDGIQMSANNSLAVSDAAMLVLGADEVVVGLSSELGPVDPQYGVYWCSVAMCLIVLCGLA